MIVIPDFWIGFRVESCETAVFWWVLLELVDLLLFISGL